MREGYLEVMVKREPTVAGKVLCLGMTLLCVFFAFLFFLSRSLIVLLLAALFGAAMYFARMNTNLEFEYLYVDKELTIDKIMAQTKRKTVIKVNMERLDVLAPLGSYRLDDYKNRLGKTADYSSGRGDAKRYMLVYEGQSGMIIEPGEQLVRMIKNNMPRKVFTD